MNVSKFGFRYRSVGGELTVSVLLDQQQIYQQVASDDAVQFLYNIPDDDLSHVIEIEMSGKSNDHTVLDRDGNIVSDCFLKITNIEFDGIDITELFAKKSTYTHNFNNNGPQTVEEFYDIMGCNGTVRLEFSSPVYLWLLENM